MKAQRILSDRLELASSKGGGRMTQKLERDKPTAWGQFPEKIHMHKGSGAVDFGPAAYDGDLQAEYVLNSVKRLKVLELVLEDVD